MVFIGVNSNKLLLIILSIILLAYNTYYTTFQNRSFINVFADHIFQIDKIKSAELLGVN